VTGDLWNEEKFEDNKEVMGKKKKDSTMAKRKKSNNNQLNTTQKTND
jgi:hypothetical protein